MYKILTYAAYGWLILGGAMHFLIDVVSQYARGKRVPGPETTLYFGLNTAFALGQVMFGLFALLVARESITILGQWPAVTLSLAATTCWLVFAFIFIEYWEPKINVAAFGLLIIAAAVAARMRPQ